MKRVLVVGEINVDLILQNYHAFPSLGREVVVDDFVMTLGSASGIAAMGLARLGTPVAFLGKVGADPWGDYCLSVMRSAGIDLSRVLRDEKIKTGVTVSITSAADRALVTYPGSIAALTGDEVPDAAFTGFQHVHLSSYFLQERLRPSVADILARASRQGLTTSLDPGFDPSERWGSDLLGALRQVDLFFPNEVELGALSGEEDLLRALQRLGNGRTRTVAKLGRRGAATLEGESLLILPSPSIETVDTTGAGDSFDAGFLHAWLQGQPLLDCLRYGCACGALSTRGLGGTSTQPSEEEVSRFIAERPVAHHP